MAFLRPLVDSTDSEVKTDLENREVGTHVMDEYPTHDEWIKKFDMDTDTPDMKKLGNGHFQHLPVWGKERQRIFQRRKSVPE